MNYSKPDFKARDSVIYFYIPLAITLLSYILVPLIFLILSIDFEGNTLFITVYMTAIVLSSIYLVMGMAKDDKLTGIKISDYNKAVKDLAKDRYGITLLDTPWKNQSRNKRMLAKNELSEFIMVDLVVIENGSDLLIFDCSQEIARI